MGAPTVEHAGFHWMLFRGICPRIFLPNAGAVASTAGPGRLQPWGQMSSLQRCDPVPGPGRRSERSPSAAQGCDTVAAPGASIALASWLGPSASSSGAWKESSFPAPLVLCERQHLSFQTKICTLSSLRLLWFCRHQSAKGIFKLRCDVGRPL